MNVSLYGFTKRILIAFSFLFLQTNLVASENCIAAWFSGCNRQECITKQQELMTLNTLAQENRHNIDLLTKKNEEKDTLIEKLNIQLREAKDIIIRLKKNEPDLIESNIATSQEMIRNFNKPSLKQNETAINAKNIPQNHTSIWYKRLFYVMTAIAGVSLFVSASLYKNQSAPHL